MDATFILSLVGIVGLVVASHFRLENRLIERIHEIDLANVDRDNTIEKIEDEIQNLKERKI